MASPAFRPMKDHHLAETLGLSVMQRPLLRNLLRDLARDGLATKVKGSRWAPPVARAETVRGSIHVSPLGHGMVRIPGATGENAEVFIPAGSLGGAIHGDLVEVEKSPPRTARPGRRSLPAAPDGRAFRPEGRVVRIVERRKRLLVGLLMKSDAYWYVIPDHPRINQNVRIRRDRSDRAIDAPAGHKVVVQLDETMTSEFLQGTIIESLGLPGAPGVDVLSILREHEIATGFSEETQQEARRQSTEPGPADLVDRLDLRGETILVIDPIDARDHDDAVSLRRGPDGSWILGVHIADVSHFVTPGSAIDADARAHGNSVYMVDRFIPMLPAYLTSEVCSLKPDRDRLAYSVFITYNADGQITLVEMAPTVIRPRILLDYDKVQQLITGKGDGGIPHEHHSVLREMNELATRLRKQRMHNGAIDLSVPEVSCTLDTEGKPVSIKRRTSAEAYHLIEEFMLAANIAVAERLAASGIPALYRIHEEPSDDQWQQMALDLQQLGVDAAPADRHDMQRIARQYAREPLAYPISIAMLRNLKRAVYSVECIPHFGLAFDRYTHFTSPIRRYSDLVVHRILKHLDARRGAFYRREECEAIADHCSRREREAAEAEEESLIIKRVQYYEALMARGETGPWPAMVTGGTTRGLFVELIDTLQRGFVPTHGLPDPTMSVDRQTGRITGRKGRVFGRVGDVIQAELIRVDANRRSVELRWVAEEDGEGDGHPRKPKLASRDQDERRARRTGRRQRKR
ncbi:MAG TPA: VacB/RNase II family 3'-5' exoribonuclease [Kiritimatiellia bacterium]|nr:VacB/RNase II family 3'-5' exoribonuclease [Kiritimatiellia bacterium]HMP34292.1 VacB/RNase II family 3'-5' exoribonuclease [Kiritimatiellia bacterium]